MGESQVTGLFFGGVETFIAADGRPMTSGIRKRPSTSAWPAFPATPAQRSITIPETKRFTSFPRSITRQSRHA